MYFFFLHVAVIELFLGNNKEHLIDRYCFFFIIPKYSLIDIILHFS